MIDPCFKLPNAVTQQNKKKQRYQKVERLGDSSWLAGAPLWSAKKPGK
jgi:hypothetical protein